MNSPVELIRFLLSFFLLSILLLVITGALIFAFWIWMIVDCAKRKFKNDSEKIVWILVIIILHVLGAAIYYFAVKASDKNSGKNKKK